MALLSPAYAQAPAAPSARTFSPSEQRQLKRATDLYDRGSELAKVKESKVEATRLVQQSLAIREKVFGKDHAETIATVNAVGLSFVSQGKYAEAQPYFERALKVYQKHIADHLMTASVHGNLGFVLEKQEKFSAALSNYKEALRINEKVQGKNHPRTMTYVSRTGRMHALLGDFSAAIPYQKRYVDVYLKIAGDTTETARSIIILGDLYRKAEQYNEARSQYERALKIRKQTLGERHPLTATLLRDLGVLLYDQGDYDGARPFLEDALANQEETLGLEHPDTALTLNDLGVLHSAQGDFKAARACHEKALAIRSTILPAGHPDIAQSLSNMGVVSIELGDWLAARPYLEKALAIYKSAYSLEHPSTLTALSHLATLLSKKGDYAEARLYYEQALEISKRMYGADHPGTAKALNELGVNLHREGKYATAQNYLEKALAIQRKVLGKEHPDTATTLHNLSSLNYTQGNLLGARLYLFEAAEISLKVHGFEHPTTASYFNGLGVLLIDQKKYTEARKYQEQALEIRQKWYGAEHPVTASSHHSLGLTLFYLKEYASSKSEMEKALAIRQKMLGEVHPATADTLLNLGALHTETGDNATARSYYEKSLAIQKTILGEEHPRVATGLINLAGVQQCLGDGGSAVESIDQARRNSLNSTIRVLSSADPQSRRGLLGKKVGEFNVALTIGYANRSEPDAVNASAGWLINGKGIAREALAQRQLLERDADDPEVKRSVGELREIRSKMAALVMTTARPEDADARTNEIHQLMIQEHNLTKQVALVVGSSVEAPEWIEVEEIREKIPPGNVFVSFARLRVKAYTPNESNQHLLPARYLAWLMPATGEGDVQLIDLGLASDIDAQISSVRKLVNDPESSDTLSETLNQGLQEMAHMIWQPIAQQLPEATKRLILSPDGALWLCPWNALRSGNERFLIEDYALRYVVSGRELMKTPNNPSNARPLVFADPTFDLSPDKTRNAVEAIFRNDTFNWDTDRGIVSQTALGKVTPLPNTRVEAAAIAPSLESITGKKPISYLGPYALETVCKRVKRPRMLALSTHGFFLPDQQVEQDNREALLGDNSRSATVLTVDGKPVENPLLRCGLLFAGCNQPAAGADDGVLTGMEIVGIDLRGTELVVLSACETGLGDIQTGEGVAGLRQAFQLAGAEAVVSTLWNVPDRDSAIIMNDFFENLADGQSKADALRTAQLKRIESRRQRYGSAHPFYWAAWTLTGN